MATAPGSARSRALALAVALIAIPMLDASPAMGDEMDDSALAYRKVMAAELEKESPEAAALIVQGDADDDAGHDFDAIDHYAQAATLVPSSPHPLRRLCQMHSKLRHRPEAIGFCRDALAKRDDRVQQTALAMALLLSPTTHETDQEAYQLAERAVTHEGQVFEYAALCEASMNLESPAGLDRCTKGLQKLAPHSVATWLYTAVFAATDKRYSDAKDAILKARSLGGNKEMLDSLEARIDSSMSTYDRYSGSVGTFFIVWMALLAFVTVAGFALSALTRAAATRLPTQRTGHAHGAARWIRVAYRIVLWIACLLFYVSLPIMIASVVVMVGGLIYVSLMVGRIPLQLLLIVCLVAFVTVGATLKSLFVKSSDEDPGPKLDLEKHVKLRDVLVEVAERVGTRRVDTVFMTAGTEFGVFERGGVAATLRGKATERCLMIGAGVLKGMRLTDFKAILAHEYGHFQNADTAGGGFALAVRRSTFHLILGLARGGAARWYNPAWWMARGFHSLFIRISHGASRLQEILADRWAAFSYGAEAFEGGLRHVVRRGVEFATVAEVKVNEALKTKEPILNLYRGSAKSADKHSEVEEKVIELLSRASSAYDSHPPPEERFALVRRLDAPTPPGEDSGAKAWDLFEDRVELERSLTRELLDRIQLKNGVRGLIHREPNRRAG